ncbi:MAG TPA: Fe-S cluster assembly ATPase SufC [Clostridiales bacterium]|jgi:Fe-S cluster assembly ATP-binding protein|nr:Fe-S cluster assembly ATPase SufC [Clostridiales bacterium]
MKKALIKIQDLHVKIKDKEILKGVNLEIGGGEIHAVMGPNGNGKSTLAAVVMGSPFFEITKGKIIYDGVDITNMPIDERARRGIFLGMQYPSEISGVTNMQFLYSAYNAINSDQKISLGALKKNVTAAAAALEMGKDMPNRYLNVGFSGGEKKRNEILQMLMLRPRFVMLDEIDSGLDIDALQTVGRNITDYAIQMGENAAFLIITHYQRLLNYVKPDFVHVLYEGKIAASGGVELSLKLESEGYEWLRQQSV